MSHGKYPKAYPILSERNTKYIGQVLEGLDEQLQSNMIDIVCNHYRDMIWSDKELWSQIISFVLESDIDTNLKRGKTSRYGLDVEYPEQIELYYRKKEFSSKTDRVKNTLLRIKNFNIVHNSIYRQHTDLDENFLMNLIFQVYNSYMGVKQLMIRALISINPSINLDDI